VIMSASVPAATGRGHGPSSRRPRQRTRMTRGRPSSRTTTFGVTARGVTR
jgi:hypothetical protein